MRKRIKLSLTLGGGGARGLAHIGVLKVLERNDIPVDMIVGTSIGSLVGAAYATNPDAEALKQRILEVLGSDGRRCFGCYGECRHHARVCDSTCSWWQVSQAQPMSL